MTEGAYRSPTSEGAYRSHNPEGTNYHPTSEGADTNTAPMAVADTTHPTHPHPNEQ